jgi:hypothetical protein
MNPTDIRGVAKSFVVPPLGGNCGWRPAKAGTTNDFAVVLQLTLDSAATMKMISLIS